MRTENPTSSAVPVGSLRARVALVGRWLGARGAGARWTVAMLILAALIIAGYAVLPSESVGWEALYNGRRFSPAEAMKISTALLASQIEAKLDKQGHILVPSNHLVEAIALIQKNKIEPRLPGDIIRDGAEPHFLEGPLEQEQRRNLAMQTWLEHQIEQLEGVASANLLVTRERTRSLTQSWNVKALVFLEAEEGRKIPASSIRMIQSLLGAIPDLKADAITVMDKEHRYVAAENPALGLESETRAREEELTSELLKRLNWIEGIKVFVRLDSPLPGQPPGTQGTTPIVELGVNTPLDAEPKTAGTRSPGTRGKVRVSVQIPNGYYIQEYHRTTPGHEPSAESLRPYVLRTEETIRNTIGHVVASDDLVLTIDRINVPGTSQPVGLPAHPDDRYSFSWWVPAAAGAAVAAGMVIGCGSLLLARRPPVQPARWNRREHERYDLGEPSGAGPGPSERVRELVRLSPEAAAGVLQRWIGQGGQTA